MLKIPMDIFSASVKKRHNKPLQIDERRAVRQTSCGVIAAAQVHRLDQGFHELWQH